ncbi:MAG: D-alanine--D-alanine ligase, partial [Oligoflexia bacterium]|nr:D-alanine--D-alanine ligase [Oligoflexia bacterium]
MKIVFTHNLKRSSEEEEAEFDSPETVAAITKALKDLGHDVEPLETNGPASSTIARLEALNPDMVFNTSEGRIGRFREAFYPGIFEQLDIPFTGSDAYTCTVTLDKNLTKLIIKNLGIPTPNSLLVSSLDNLKHFNLNFPVIIKPNFEGSSKGITKNSVIKNTDELKEKIHILLSLYPDGVLVEEFIFGRDIAVPFLEGTHSKNKGILSPIEYFFSEESPSFMTSSDQVNAKPSSSSSSSNSSNSSYSIYDYDLKNHIPNQVNTKVPAAIEESVSKQLVKMSSTIYKALNIRDFGRIDFRITPDNKIYFIEVNALPSLGPECGIYAAAAEIGLIEMKDVLNAILQNASHRFKIQTKKRSGINNNNNNNSNNNSGRGSEKRLKIGLAYNEKRIIPDENPNTDTEAEFDAPKTLDAVRNAIRSYGHEV